MELSSRTKQKEIETMQTRMKTSWSDASKEEKKMYTEKATEACEVNCNVICPSDGQICFMLFKNMKGIVT